MFRSEVRGSRPIMQRERGRGKTHSGGSECEKCAPGSARKGASEIRGSFGANPDRFTAAAHFLNKLQRTLLWIRTLMPPRAGTDEAASVPACARRCFSAQVISSRVRTSCTETQVINVTASPVSLSLTGALPAPARSKPPLLLRRLPLTLHHPCF